MKRGVMLLGLFLIFSIFFLSNISAELNSSQINDGYNCVQNRTEDCSSALDENIFTLLSIKECKDEVLQSASSGECWPTGSCNIKQTSQALLALKESGSDTAKPKAWLLNHTRSPTNMKWFLQIDSPEATTCTISYKISTGELRSYEIFINDSKKIDKSAGSCLPLAQDYGNYWLEIASTSGCQGYEYEISCDKEFVTGKLFKETSSSTIHVLEDGQTASSGVEIIEKVNSLCFADGSSCSYEGTLWAAFVLNSMGEEVSQYLPYLVVMADNNPNTLPQAFLYMLLGESYLNDLLLKQKSGQYWEVSGGNRYYDTALALLALRPDDSAQKENALDWLGDTQGADGCWQNSVKNTAFLLYAISPRGGSSGGNNTPSKPDCETAGYSCIYSSSCTAAGGNVLDNYQCSLGLNCCDREPSLLSCVQGQGGTICDSDEECVGGIEVDSSDTGTFTTCCIDGSCRPKENGGGGGGGEEDNACEEKFGTCSSFGCDADEEANNLLSCDSPSETCCIKKSGTTNYLWIWVLVILIIIVGLSIVFRDKLKTFWLYLKTKFGPGHSPGMSSGHSYFPTPVRRMAPRRIIPHMAPSHSQNKPSPQKRNSGELDEVLKKLRDMSK